MEIQKQALNKSSFLAKTLVLQFIFHLIWMMAFLFDFKSAFHMQIEEAIPNLESQYRSIIYSSVCMK